jgi:hypothetical protein
MDKQEGPQQSDQMDALEWGKSSGKRNVQQTHNGCRNRHDDNDGDDVGVMMALSLKPTTLIPGRIRVILTALMQQLPKLMRMMRNHYLHRLGRRGVL